MKNKILYSGICLAIIVVSSCSPVRIFSDPELSVKSGLKYFTVKPFLEIQRDPGTNKVVKATVLYLPDLSNPQYLALKNAPGAGKVDLKFTDGSISTLGFTYDSKIEESVDALAALISKSSGAIADLNSLKNPSSFNAVSNTIELYEIVFGAEGTSLKEIKIGID